MAGRRVGGALALLVTLAGLALAGDVAAARRAIDFARSELKASNFGYVEPQLKRAEQALDGLDAATRGPLEQEIAQVRRELAAAQRENTRQELLRSFQSSFEHLQRMLDDMREDDTRVRPGWTDNMDSLRRWLGEERAQALTPQDRAMIEARMRKLEADLEAKAIAGQLFLTEKHLKLAEDVNAGRLEVRYTHDMDGHLEVARKYLAECPPTDPRTRALAQRLEQAEAQWRQRLAADEKATTIQRAVDHWTYLKENNAEVAGWEQESIDYARWRQQGSLDLDKTALRHSVAGQLLEDERYQKAVAAHAGEAPVQAMVAEVTRWRAEASQKVVSAAKALLDEAEGKLAEQPEDLASDLQRLKDELERHADPPARDPLLARIDELSAKAMAEAEAQRKAREEQYAAEEAEAAEKAEDEKREREIAAGGAGFTFLRVLMGLVGCTLMLVGGGAVGFAGMKLSQLSKAAAAPPA